MRKWTSTDMPSLVGRTAVITGTGGLAWEDALALTHAGCDVILAGRNPDKGLDALARIRAAVPQANVRFERLDLASLASVREFGARLREERERLDVLVNNAAVMTPPDRQTTRDGFELQLGTNYLGHFALTAELMPLLRRGRDPRVVTLSSVASRSGQIDFDDLQSEARYQPMKAYGQSKLACLMFALELARRSEASGWGVSSIAAHPGISRTDLLLNAPGRLSLAAIMRRALWFLFQPAAQGALPTLFAASSPDATSGSYYGPDKLGETRGHPTLAKVPTQATDRASSARLWELSEQLTGASFQVAPQPAVDRHP